MKTNTALLTGLLLAGCLLASSCGDSAVTADSTTQPTGTESAEETETSEPDPFAEFDYGGASIRVYTSTNAATGIGNSNYLIEGPEEETGDVVSDAAYARNRRVEEILNVKFVYTDVDETYDQVSGDINKIVMAGDDIYDIIINDLFPLANLSLQGEFMNMADAPYIDRTQAYWYDDWMQDTSIDGKKIFLMAGDYFIDVLRSAHALYFNKNMMGELYDSSDIVYDDVLAGTWTYDKLLSYMAGAVQDLDGDGKYTLSDRYGLSVMQIWGPSIPFIVSADPTYATQNSDGTLTLALNNDRSVKLLEKLNEIFYSDATCNAEKKGSSDAETDSLNLFKNGQSLFLGYFRLGSLETLRDMDYEVGIVPYPKLDDSQENYITSSHDTTEVGVIPVTCGQFDMTCAVLEVLNRETQEIVLPAYYETALKVKYTRDEVSAQMIDIIHNSISGSFALAYNDFCGGALLQSCFYTPLSAGQTDFASNYAKKEKSIQKALDKLVDAFASIES